MCARCMNSVTIEMAYEVLMSACVCVCARIHLNDIILSMSHRPTSMIWHFPKVNSSSLSVTFLHMKTSSFFICSFVLSSHSSHSCESTRRRKAITSYKRTVVLALFFSLLSFVFHRFFSTKTQINATHESHKKNWEVPKTESNDAPMLHWIERRVKKKEEETSKIEEDHRRIDENVEKNMSIKNDGRTRNSVATMGSERETEMEWEKEQE